MFLDMGLTHQHSSAQERFEVDGANAARDFLRSHASAQKDIETVWTAIALHTTPGIPQHMHPVVALVTAGVEMDVLGISYAEYSEAERDEVVHAHPRTAHFKEDIIQAFYDYDDIKHKPETTFGNIKADVLAKDPISSATVRATSPETARCYSTSLWSPWRSESRRRLTPHPIGPQRSGGWRRRDFLASRRMGEPGSPRALSCGVASPREESLASAIAVQAIEAQPAFGQI
jgi:hypothetical protein